MRGLVGDDMGFYIGCAEHAIDQLLLCQAHVLESERVEFEGGHVHIAHNHGESSDEECDGVGLAQSAM